MLTRAWVQAKLTCACLLASSCRFGGWPLASAVSRRLLTGTACFPLPPLSKGPTRDGGNQGEGTAGPCWVKGGSAAMVSLLACLWSAFCNKNVWIIKNKKYIPWSNEFSISQMVWLFPSYVQKARGSCHLCSCWHFDGIWYKGMAELPCSPCLWGRDSSWDRRCWQRALRPGQSEALRWAERPQWSTTGGAGWMPCAGGPASPWGWAKIPASALGRGWQRPLE